MVTRWDGAALKQLRLKLSLSQEALGKAAGMDQTRIGRYETTTRGPDLLTALALATALEIPLQELVRVCVVYSLPPAEEPVAVGAPEPAKKPARGKTRGRSGKPTY